MSRELRQLHVIGLTLLLAGLTAPAMAQNGRNATADGSGCAAATDIETPADPQDESRTPAPAAAKSAKPSAARASDGGDVHLRQHPARWHSFLPGMFR
ncbi:hypothetical protein CSC70_00055 [Pseudoxanthomonas kalamensis DSM 18571]|uniref:hypothetical protein n=1 Tax=Pseudoxanthomonas kalamensis TaxID=289483 RepID=UPI0013908EA8|nr:hypothetical protein [Pseudoxanthomonas kalamensis]KAF1711978.1 hypothetical protein CSC70_00055 [Pseudoxanthomonas kalamensis DSM 18571]